MASMTLRDTRSHLVTSYNGFPIRCESNSMTSDVGSRKSQELFACVSMPHSNIAIATGGKQVT